VVKEQGGANDLLDRLKKDPAFAKLDLAAATDAKKFIGRAPEQVDQFLADVVEPIRKRYAKQLSQTADVKV
jgi:adenylosuccinate lyase